jgi:hypothetical protein
VSAERPRRRVSTADVARNGWTVIGREVFDLSRFAGRHAGGRAAIEAVGGGDATSQFLAAHAKDGLALRILDRVRVGELDESSSNAEDRELSALAARFRAEGLFDVRARWLAADLTGILVPFLAALALARWSAPLSFALLCVATLHHAYWAHDARHDAVFARGETARRGVDLLGNLVLGVTLNPLADDHRMHHAFTNRLGLDRALEVGGLVWHERHLAARRRWWTRHQALLFPAAILPFAFLYMLRAGISYLWRRRQRLLLGATVVRWIALALWLRSPLLVLLPPVLVSWFQALVSSLNHYHLPMADGPESSHARTMIVRTQNTGTGLLWTWLSGASTSTSSTTSSPPCPAGTIRASRRTSARTASGMASRIRCARPGRRPAG